MARDNQDWFLDHFVKRELVMGGIRLTAAKVTGDFDGVDYNDLRVQNVAWNLRNDSLTITYQLGNFDDGTGEFTEGFEGPKKYVIRDTPGGDQDYTTFFNESFKQGSDTNAERFLEMLTNLLSLRLGLPGVSVKPGRSGRRKI